MRKWAKIFTAGDVFAKDILEGEVSITEKVDGSQINFGVNRGIPLFASKGADIEPDSAQKLFRPAIAHILSVQGALREGWTYHGETLAAPRHNTLAYERVPKGHIALYGVVNDGGEYLAYDDVKAESERLQIECVPEIWRGDGSAIGKFSEFADEMLKRVSFLGAELIEGIVLKNYGRAIQYHGLYFPLTQAKYVSERFKERHKDNPEFSGPMDKLGRMVRTDARWDKAVQGLRESGEFTGTVKDIGACLKRLHQDIDAEDVEFFKDELWKLFGRDIKKMACRGFPEWFKKRLADGELDERDTLT